MSSAAQLVDVVVVGGGHNGLTAAAYLAEAGRSVVVLERTSVAGGAARSERAFPGFDANVSTYAYLVSLLPDLIIDELGLDIELATRRISSYTPVGDRGILIDQGDPGRTAADLGADADAWHRWYDAVGQVAATLAPTLTEPLRSADSVRSLIDAEMWMALFERPIAPTLRERFSDDVVRGVVATDGLIGAFSDLDDPGLLGNRCYLYHVVGRGTGRWDVPVGGMGRVSGEIARAATSRGASIETECEVTSIDTDGQTATVHTADGRSFRCRQVLSGVAPAVLDRLLGDSPRGPVPEGAQLKVNMLLRRLPSLRDPSVTTEQAFAGTFHVNESLAQIERAYKQAASGQIPDQPPCESYCHSLADPSILSADLRADGVQTLTMFGLHMPTRLFRDDPDGSRERALAATIASLDSVLAEPLADCLLGPDTIEAVTPVDLEHKLAMPGGNIWHRDLQWPFAESADEVGQWGVETRHANVFLCGAGARRGGGVSGIPGRNAAMAALAQ